MYVFDEAKTHERIKKLQRYYAANVSSDGHMRCKQYPICDNDVARKHLDMNVGQLQHVGKKYDISKDGKKLRLVISGVSYGSISNRSMEERWNDVVVRGGCQERVSPATRTGHAIGTTNLLKYILLGDRGIIGNNWADWSEEFTSTVGEPDEHIFNMCAWVNFLICCATEGGHETDKTPVPLAYRCFPHYLETLRILEPNLVICQQRSKDPAKKYEGWFERCLEQLGMDCYWNQINENWGRYDDGKLRFVACNFYHPSVRNSNNWSHTPEQPYFRNTIIPTLDHVLREIEWR